MGKSGSDTDKAGQGARELPPLRSLAEFHNDPHYGGDLHRADLAWARHAAAMGLSESEIRAAILGRATSPRRATPGASANMPSAPPTKCYGNRKARTEQGWRRIVV
jgi:hypothetical protein